MRRRLVALAVAFGATGAMLMACEDGDGPTPYAFTPERPDATSPPPPPPIPDAAVPTPPRIAAADLVVYTGMTANIDASGTVAETYQWTVKSAPPTSAVATATLAGASSPKPTFRADVSGDYVLELTAKNGGVSATKEVKVKAVPAPLFYIQTTFAAPPAHYEYRTIGTDGTGGHAVGCKVNGDPGAAAGDDPVLQGISTGLADVGLDWWEAPPGVPSRVAFADFGVQDGGVASTIGLGTSASTCVPNPVQVRTIPEDSGTSDPVQALMQPRFSRDGARVAYLEVRSSGWFLATVGSDGTARRDLARLCPDGVGTEGCFVADGPPARPQWRDNQTVGWTRVTATGWEIVVATDSAAPMPRVYMTCDGNAPRSFALLGDGKVLANREAAGSGREDLWLLQPQGAGGACQVIKNLTNLKSAGSYARDFALSPDETQVAFLLREEPDDGGVPEAGVSRFGGEIYTVPVSGATAPARITGAAQEAIFGPRYVAGASMLAWNGVLPDAGSGATPIDGGLPVLAVAPVGGGPATQVAASNPDAGIYLVGGGSGASCDFRACSVIEARSNGGGALALAALTGALLLVRRRRPRGRAELCGADSAAAPHRGGTRREPSAGGSRGRDQKQDDHRSNSDRA